MRRLGQTKSSTRGRRPNPKRAVIGREWRRRALIAVVAALPLVGAALLWPSGGIKRIEIAVGKTFVQTTVRLGLTVERVLVEGRHHTTRDELITAIGLSRGSPIMAYRIEAARARLESLPWVGAARVERRLPGTVYVRIVERVPMAWWQRGGRLTLVDTSGLPIEAKRVPDAFRKLLVVVGEDAPSHAPGLIAVLDREPALRKRVEGAVWIGSRRWNLKLTNGIDVRLPESNPAAALTRLAKLDRELGLLDSDIRLVDLRVPDRLVLRRGKPRGKGSGKST